MRNLSIDGLGDNVPLDYLACEDRLIKPGGSFLVAIKLADGTFYGNGSYGDAGDEGNLPAPMIPRKLIDFANHGVASGKRQR